MEIKIIMLGGKSKSGKSYIANYIKSQIKNSFILSLANPMKYLLLNFHNAILSKDWPYDIWYQNVLFPIFNDNIMFSIKNKKYNLNNSTDFIIINLLLFSQISDYFDFYNFEKLNHLLHLILEKEMNKYLNFKFNNDENIRKFLQYWGSDIIRNQISENAWIYLYLIRIYRSLNKFKKFKKIYILTDDVRFNNEITIALENKLINISEIHFIYLYGINKQNDYQIEQKNEIYNHFSENSLNLQNLINYNDDKLFIYVIKNNFKIDNIIKSIIKTNII